MLPDGFTGGKSMSEIRLTSDLLLNVSCWFLQHYAQTDDSGNRRGDRCRKHTNLCVIGCQRIFECQFTNEQRHRKTNSRKDGDCDYAAKANIAGKAAPRTQGDCSRCTDTQWLADNQGYENA